MDFEDRAAIGKIQLSNEGYMLAASRVARTGIQLYRGSEMGRPEMDIVRVYRPENAVFARDSMASYAGKPVTINHPTVPVTSDNWKDLSVGNILQGVARDGEFIVVPFQLMHKGAVEKVKDGLNELSMGYSTEIEWKAGTTPNGEQYDAVQCGPIMINHLAIVEKARGGNQLKIGDAANSWGIAPITDHKRENVMATIIVDGLSVDTTEQGAQAINKLLADRATANTALDAANSSHKIALDAANTEIGKLTAEIQTLKDGALKPADIDKLVSERSDVLAVVKNLDAAFVSDGKSISDLKRHAISKAFPNLDTKGKEDAFIDGVYSTIPKENPIKTALRPGPANNPVSDADANTVDAAYNKYMADMQSAWNK